MIRTVFFDFDGVLTTDSTGSLTTLRSLARQTGLAEEALWTAFAPFNHDLLSGRTTHARAWPDICIALGRSLPFECLETAFRDTPINRPMLALARTLATRRSVGIITDNKADRMDVLRRLHGLDDIFDPIVVSAEVGSGKQEPRIFEYALQRVGRRAEECLFIDNTATNLRVPAAMGMHALHFDGTRGNAEGLRDALAMLGLTPATAERTPET